MRRFVLLCLVTVLLAATPAAAIDFGQPDGGRHPFVGAMFVKLGGGTLRPWCTGTIVSKRVFLTAGHCTYDAEAIHGSAGYDLGVTFVPDLGFDDPVPMFDERDLVMGVGYTHRRSCRTRTRRTEGTSTSVWSCSNAIPASGRPTFRARVCWTRSI